MKTKKRLRAREYIKKLENDLNAANLAVQYLRNNAYYRAIEPRVETQEYAVRHQFSPYDRLNFANQDALIEDRIFRQLAGCLIKDMRRLVEIRRSDWCTEARIRVVKPEAE